jgi:hypothetical protein
LRVVPPLDASREASHGWRALAVATALLLAFCSGAFDLADYDLGLAVATGREIVTSGAVPRTNVFSAIDPDFPFVDDKWLFHVFAHLVVDELGAAAAVAIRIALLAATLLVLLPRRRDRFASATYVLLLPLAVLTAHERFAFRPELFSMFFVAWFFRTLTASEPLGKRRIALLLVAQATWINLHGYFVLGPIIAAAVAVGALADAWLARRQERTPAVAWKPLAALVPLLLLACLVNPYGFALLRSPVDILLDLRVHGETYRGVITEFAAPFDHFDLLASDLLAFRVLLGLCVLALAATFLRRKRPPLRVLLPLLAFLLMALDLRRNMANFALVATPFVVAALSRAAAARESRARWIASSGVAFALLVAFLFVTDRIAVNDRLDRSFGFGHSTIAHPDLEVDFALANLPPDGMFNAFQFGSYFVGRAYPSAKPFLDGNTAGYPPEFLAEYARAIRGEIPPDELVERHGLRWFLLKPGHPLTFALLASTRYVPLFLGRQAVVIGVRDRLDPELVARCDLRPALESGSYVPAATTLPVTATRARFPLAEINRGRLELALDLVARAERSALAAAAIADVAEAWHLAGIARLRKRDARGAREALDRAVERAPRDAAMRADRAVAAFETGDVDLAAHDLEYAIAARGEDADLLLRRARVRLALRRTAEALQDLDRARDLTASGPLREALSRQIEAVRQGAPR